MEAATVTPQFPVAFRPPAFASRSSDSRRGVRPSLRSAYRTRPDPDGVTAFHTHELRPGWVPPIPRGRRCSPDRPIVSGRRLPLLSDQSLHPATASHRAEPQITRHQRRFTRFTRPSIPLACGPRMERAPLGFSPELRTPPTGSRRRTSGWGRAMSTSPGLRSRHQPNLQSAHPLATCDLASHRQALIMLATRPARSALSEPPSARIT